MSVSVRSRRAEYESMSRGDLIDSLCERDGGPCEDSRVLRALRSREAELEEQNQRLRAERDNLAARSEAFTDMFDLAPLPYFVFDRNGIVKSANEGAAALLRVDRAGMIGLPFTCAATVVAKQTFFDHIARCVDERVRVMSEIEVEVRSRGRLVLRAASTPVVRASAPLVLCCRTLLDDITRHSRAEAALRMLAAIDERLATAQSTRGAIEAIAAACVPALGDACFIDLCEREDLESMQRVEIVAAGGAETIELLQKQGTDAAWRLYEAQLARTLTPVFEPATAAALGATFERRLGARGLLILPLSAGGQSLGVLGIVLTNASRTYSLADFETARDFARRASRALLNARASERTAAVLRNHDEVVAAVSNDLDALLRDIGDDRGPARGSAVRLARVVRDMRDVCCMDVTQRATAGCSADVGALAAQAIAKAAPAARGRGVTIEHAPGAPQTARCDAQVLARAFEALLDAAIDVTPPRQTVTVRVEKSGTVVRATVSDGGPPLDEAEAACLFDACSPARDARTPRGRGRLGLYVARVIIEAHGGTIGTIPRDGHATWFFTLPAALAS